MEVSKNSREKFDLHRYKSLQRADAYTKLAAAIMASEEQSKFLATQEQLFQLLKPKSQSFLEPSSFLYC